MPVDELRSLPAVVRAAARDSTRLKAMQAELGCVWRALFWTSLKGSCFGEPLSGDAFDALMRVLARRRAAAAGSVPPAESSTACDAAARPLPAHLLDADGSLAKGRLAPGSTFWA